MAPFGPVRTADWAHRKVAGWKSLSPLAAFRSILEQDTKPQMAPDEQLAPCMAASDISV